MENNQKVPSKSSKGALLIAGILVVILIAAVSAIIFLLIKNFDNKDTVQSETTNQSVSEEVVNNEEMQPENKEQEYEKEQEQALNTDESTDADTAPKAQPNTAQDNQAENKQMQAVIPDGKSIFLPVEMKIYDMNGDIIEQTKYNWLMYKDNTDYYKGNLDVFDAYYWNGNNQNTWSESLLNKINLNTNYLNNIGNDWNNKIANHTWQIGGNTYDNILKNTVKNTY